MGDVVLLTGLFFITVVTTLMLICMMAGVFRHLIEKRERKR